MRSVLARWGALLAATLMTVLLVSTVTIEPAVATSTVHPESASLLAADQGPAETIRYGGSLSWIDLKDTTGVKIWKYKVYVDHGGITAAGKMVWSTFILIVWQFYLFITTACLWFMDWVNGLGIIQVIYGPLKAAAGALSSVLDSLGLKTALLTITGLVAAVHILKGRWATGLWEVAAAGVVAALATGLLASPVDLIAGPNGAVSTAQQAGLQLGVATAGDSRDMGNASLDELRETQSSQMVDAFVVLPTQILNFGAPLSTKCDAVYRQSIDKGPYADEDDKVRDAVGDCDKNAGEVAKNPGSGMFFNALVFMPAGFVLCVLCALVSFGVLMSVLRAAATSVKLVWDLLVGLLPGSARGPLLSSAADVIMHLIVLVLSSTFLGILISVITAIFDFGGENKRPVVETFFVVDLVLVAGALVWWRWRSRLEESSRRLAEKMAWRPQASPSAIPAPGPNPDWGRMRRAAAIGAFAGRRSTPDAGTPPAAGTTNNVLIVTSPLAGDGRRTREGSAEFVQPEDQPAQTRRAAIEHPVRRQLTAGPRDTQGGGGPSLPPGPAGAATTAAKGLASLHPAGRAAVVASRAVKAPPPRTARRAELEAKIGAPSSGPRPPAPTSASPRPPQFDRIVRDGQVLLVPTGGER